MTTPQEEFDAATAVVTRVISGALQAHHVGPLPMDVPMGPFHWNASIGQGTSRYVVLVLRCPPPGEDHYVLIASETVTPELVREEMTDLVASLYLHLGEKGGEDVRPLMEYLPVTPESLKSAQEDRARLLDVLQQASLFTPSRGQNFDS